MRWFRRKQPGALSQIEQLRRSLALPARDFPIEDLFPIIVPSSFFALDNWPGPFQKLRTADLGLTWAFLQPSQTMVYFSHEHAKHFQSLGIDWATKAVENLVAHTGARTWTHVKQNGNCLIFVAMMHEDGFGPSRLLLADALSRAFPQGYRVAIPERSCGIAFANNLAGDELQSILRVDESCHRDGTRPMSAAHFSPSDLAPAV
jgi:hypothetical protein